MTALAIAAPPTRRKDHRPMAVEIIDVQSLYRGWLELLRARLRTGEGEEIAREIEDHGAAACVLPYDPDARTAMLVRQLRAPVLYAAGRDSTLEAIAGIVEDEDPAACAGKGLSGKRIAS